MTQYQGSKGHDATSDEMTTSQKQLQNRGLQKALGSNDEHQGLLHRPRQVPDLSCGLKEHRGESNGAEARMWESKMFTEEQMMAWENRPAVDQSWTNL